MSADCYYIKNLEKGCTNGVRKYKIKIIEPAKGGGVCQFNLKDVKDGDIVEDPCTEDECSTLEYSNNSKFNNTMLCLIDSFNTTFATEFSTVGNCSSDKLIKQSFKLVVGPEADLSDCSIKVGQSIDLTSSKICGDINQTISNFNDSTDKKNFVVKVIDRVISKQPKYIQDKTEFIDRFKKLMVEKLMNVSGGVNSKCSQTISISQDQNVYFLGNIKCKGSEFKFTQEAIVNAYISCITGPIFDNLQKDQLLIKYYNQSPDADCVFDFQITEPCDGEERKVKVNILTPKKGKGTCEYSNNQVITQKCTTDNCQVSEWGKWSPCLQDETQFRSRRIILQGKDCPVLFQQRECKYEDIRERPNSKPSVPKRKNIVNVNGNFYKVFTDGPSVLIGKDKILFYAFFIFFFIVLIYAIFS